MRTVLATQRSGPERDVAGRADSRRLHRTVGLSDRDPAGVIDAGRRVLLALRSGVHGPVLEDIATLERAHPDCSARCGYWRAVLAAARGELDLVESEARAVLARGDWWGRSLFAASPQLRVSLPPSVLAAFRANWVNSPTVEVIVPSGRGPFPTLIVLHGQGQGLRRLRSVWPASVPRGWAVIMVESGQHLWSSQAACWDDQELATHQLRDVIAGVERDETVDSSRLFLGGFSQGAMTAARVAQTAPAVSGLVLVSPVAGSLGATATRPLPTWVLTGRADHCGPSPQRVIEVLGAKGASVTVEPHRLGHVYPADFPERLREAMTRLA